MERLRSTQQAKGKPLFALATRRVFDKALPSPFLLTGQERPFSVLFLSNTKGIEMKMVAAILYGYIRYLVAIAVVGYCCISLSGCNHNPEIENSEWVSVEVLFNGREDSWKTADSRIIHNIQSAYKEQGRSTAWVGARSRAHEIRITLKNGEAWRLYLFDAETAHRNCLAPRPAVMG